MTHLGLTTSTTTTVIRLPIDPNQQQPSSAPSSSSTTSIRHVSHQARFMKASAKLKATRLVSSIRWKEHVGRASHLSEPRQPIIVIGKADADDGIWKDIHPSHSRTQLKNIIFCKMCGLYGSRHIIKLKLPCKIAPVNSCGRSTLTRMLSGLHPVRTVSRWPDGTSTREPVPTIFLDG
jgi:transcription elongation factor Elf1